MEHVTGTMKVVNDYVDDIVSGRVTACKSIIGACKRHLDDLEKQNTEDFPYYFDESHADKMVRFFPAMVKHSIGIHEGSSFELLPWQAFVVASIFGWKKVENGARRFNKAYISVARKNGKSSLAAAICHLCAGFDVNPTTGKPEGVAQVVIAATKKEQADAVTMAECVRMRDSSPNMKERSDYKNRILAYQHNGGTIRTVGSDRPFDGLNPSLVIIDELHAFRDQGKQVEFLDTMKTGSGARLQPLYIVTTTAGTTSSTIWLQEYRYATMVARGEFNDESYFSMSYELDEDDDAMDESLWIKANPCLGVTVKTEFLEEQARPARSGSSDALRRFERYHGNRVVSSTAGAFNMDQWKSCSVEFIDKSAWSRNAVCVGAGVDLGGRNDLAAWALVAKHDTGQVGKDGQPEYIYEGFARAYISPNCPRDLTKEPFPDFIASGDLVVTENPISALESDLLREAQAVGGYELAFDPYQAQRTSEFFCENGMLPVIMPQTCAHFNAPIEEIRACIRDGRLRHDGGKLLQWCVGNAVVVEDKQNRLMMNKKESSEKIDPLVAFTMAFSRAMNGTGRGDFFLVY